METTPKAMTKAIHMSIRKALLKFGSATKRELSEYLDISFPTISKFLKQMEKDGEVFILGFDQSSGGRRAIRYTYNPEYMLGLALILEKTETYYTIFNCMGDVKKRGSTQSVLLEKGLEFLTNFIETLLIEYPKIRSIAIGVPGAVDNGHVFFIPEYELFQNLNIQKYLEERLGIPVVVENDMNAAVYGYYTVKGDEDMDSLVYLYSGYNGPGAGIMINGDVVRGSTFFSGEVRFIPQYNDRNFGDVIQKKDDLNPVVIKEEEQIDAISRLIAAFVAIINPHEVIFCDFEVDENVLNAITEVSAKYVPAEHLPRLTSSNWKEDYFAGLQNLGCKLMITT